MVLAGVCLEEAVLTLGRCPRTCLPWPQVKAELAPYEKKMGEVNARISVAEQEMNLLQRQQKDAAKKLDESAKCVGAGCGGLNGALGL